jgi:hypothetical protein
MTFREGAIADLKVTLNEDGTLTSDFRMLLGDRITFYEDGAGKLCSRKVPPTLSDIASFDVRALPLTNEQIRIAENRIFERRF